MWLHTSCKLTFSVAVPSPFILMLRLRSGAQQWVSSEEYTIRPSVPVIEFTDSYGNLCQRLVAPPCAFSIYTAANVITADQVDKSPGAPFVEVEHLPEAVLSFLLPSRYCESDCFCEMATAIVAGQQPGYDQVKAIENWLRSSIRFAPGSSDTPVSAIEVNNRQWGVCRDFSHLGIALCRSLTIPARLVVDYLFELEPMDLHAWFEAYIGGRWYTFDATQAELRGGYVAIAYGRDAADVAIYNQFGPPVYPITQDVRVELIEECY
ncbi:Transglutaminase-like enzyme, putative cysteine protease [Alteromonadaceae bacterium Bs31]|nr:Transglutaminase-like enzyme, putative cysteine protease [Alteromonadaceae bacterium Bs31]